MKLFRLMHVMTVAALSLLLAWPAHAQQQVNTPQDLVALTQQWVDQALAQLPADASPLRMQVQVGQLDSRLRLAPCQRVEPYLPPGARLWGRTRLGLRCLEGETRWNVFLPLTVQAFGPAWVLTGNVASGATLTESDAMQSEVDWAANPAAVVTNPQAWVGQVAALPLSAGQALRQNMVRAPYLFKAGAPVQIRVQGPGFAVTSSGQAMAAGAAGQNVRIRMANGKIISGIVNFDGTIEAAL
ncbi:MAG: flagella basal body P-ring formation protein FlgA [Comamonas sp. SCN 65-56]|uniref:flagellar basal body P-ring formation chaperone FlgA n=1 Tax=Comamonas sp. SCN 65-56 TaxID=1660095 RepID=UPI00086A56C4|nr:flagellar basal body P-ring formation chaperone FlgA [Comamonas sp. SCN 65-56]ODS90619.1 MAG: flagella basal body P-ring formation protein FlgA [Comamonas sp. SCN 65-56]